jgi:diguanylate cyclase (GGDEF)-like protein/PAS domain S-box-containing protein
MPRGADAPEPADDAGIASLVLQTDSGLPRLPSLPIVPALRPPIAPSARVLRILPAASVTYDGGTMAPPPGPGAADGPASPAGPDAADGSVSPPSPDAAATPATPPRPRIGATLPGLEAQRRRRTDAAGSGPRLQRVLADPSNQPVASSLLHLDPVLVALADSERHFRALIEQAADGIVVVDGRNRITLANLRACAMTGYPLSDIIGVDLLETYIEEERDLGRQQLDQPLGATMRFERRLLRRDGSTIPIDVSVAWLGSGERQLIMRDVTARQRAEDAQLAEEKRLRSLLRISEVECSSVPELLNVTLAEVVALSDSAFGYIYAYDEANGVFTLHSWSREAAEANQIADPKWTYELARSGIWAEVESQRQPIVINNLGGADPTGQAAADGAVPVSRFMTIPVISRGEMVAVVGVANKAEPYTDTDVSQLTQIMDVVWKIADRQQADGELRHFAEQLEARVEERTREFERANAELEAANTEIAAANQELQALLREQERLQSELAYRALHDPLTGLANRSMFQDRLDHAFRVSERGVAVLWIDLDHFKEVNDIFGHEVGDEMLVAVADRLRDVVRETDDIARIGGDEFAVVLPNVVESEAQMVAERVLASLTDRSAFRLQVQASIGVGWQHNVTGDGRVLIRRADQAMYRAKAAGGNRSINY